MTKPKGIFKKRVNKGNRYYRISKESVVQSLTPSTSSESRPRLTEKPVRPISASKRKLSCEFNENGESVNVIIDFNLLVSAITKALACKECGGDITISEKCWKRSGLASYFEITCNDCGANTQFCSSNVCEKTNTYEINIRLFYGMRCIGRGLTPTKILCGMLNLSPPLTKTDKLVEAVGSAIQSVAEHSMKAAVFEAVEENESDSNLGMDIPIAFDATWQKRGHVSKNAVATITSFDTGKVIDVEVLSKYCHKCALKKTPVHECSMNYQGSSGGMETVAAIEMFHRSENTRGVRYTKFLGDGDSSAFGQVMASKPYKDVEISKLECIGHIQKRMGCRLRKLKAKYSGQTLSDGKPIKGANRLTDSLIDKFQDYYGKAIRNNCDNVDKMVKSVWAIWFHRLSTDENPQHALCDKDWCGYLKAKAAKAQYKHKPTPEAIMLTIKPIFKDLANKELLRKCLHGKTQNCNESFNNVIWSRVPKTNFVGKKMLKLGVWDAVCTYNDGAISRLHVLKECGVSDVGKNTVAAMKAVDELRVKKAEIAVLQLTKEARTERRKKRLMLDSKDSDKHYQAGGF
jgi:hypothetical protein